MRKLFLALAFLIPASASSAQPPADSEIIDAVVAAVEGEPVTVSDVRSYTRTVGTQGNGGTPEPSTAEFKKATRDYIISILLEKEAEALNITVDQSDVDNYVRAVQKQNGVDEAAFEELLKSRGLTPEEYRKQITAEILRSRVVAQKLRAKVQVSDEDVLRHAAENPELLPEKGEIALQQVQVTIEEGQSAEEAKEKAESLLEQAKDGQDISTFQGYTDLGYVGLDDLIEEIQEGAKGVEVGEFSEVIETGKGFTFVKVVDVREEDGEIPEELKESIRAKLLESKMQQAMNDTLADELLKKYTVELK